MNVTTTSTIYPRHISNRILKGDTYLYAHTYLEAGDYGIIALDPGSSPGSSTMSVLGEFKLNNDRISDFCVYSDSRIAVRSDTMLHVLSFNGTSFRVLWSLKYKSKLNTGIACNGSFAFVSCGDNIVSFDMSTGKIAQKMNIPNSYYARGIYATDDYLFVRKCSIDFKKYKLAVYWINDSYAIGSQKNLTLIDEIDSPDFDMDLGRLSVDASLNVIETGNTVHRVITFDGSFLTVVGELTPFYPALEFVKHGDYYFISPDRGLKVFSMAGTVLTKLYETESNTKFSSYRCPGFSPYAFFSSRDIPGDVIGRNISKNLISP